MRKTVSIPFGALQREMRYPLLRPENRYGITSLPEDDPVFNTLRLQGEQYMLGLIALGDPARVERFLAEAPPDGFVFETGHTSENEDLLARYLVVSAVTLFTRTAIYAGLPVSAAFALDTTIMRQMDTLSGPQQIYPLLFEALRVYCSAVHDHRLSACSHPVRMCCEYIETNICAPLRVSALGDVCGLSAKYLSELFQKELGMSPKSYILRRKLEHARFRLVEHREQPIAEIAFLYSFPDHSHFSAQFRKLFGVTPQEVRRQAFAGFGIGEPPEPPPKAPQNTEHAERL